MGIMFKVLWVILHLACIAMDVAIFFLLIRIVLKWTSVNWLEQLNDVGKLLVDAIAEKVHRFWYRAVQKQLSCQGELLVSLIALLIARLVVSELGLLL